MGAPCSIASCKVACTVEADPVSQLAVAEVLLPRAAQAQPKARLGRMACMSISDALEARYSYGGNVSEFILGGIVVLAQCWYGYYMVMFYGTKILPVLGYYLTELRLVRAPLRL